jgi:hypothetical protein
LVSAPNDRQFSPRAWLDRGETIRSHRNAANCPAQAYGRLFDHTRAAELGVIGIRVLAGGALSGSAERHPIASPPGPIGSVMTYDADVALASGLMPLVKEGLCRLLNCSVRRPAT